MEPERRIEKLLRAFAKKRREQVGDPVELHPVSRQQLQKEIARRSAKTSGGGWFSSFFFGLKPGLAFAFCVIAVAAVGLILLPNLKKPKPTTFASANLPHREIAPAEKATPVMTPPPVSSTVTVAAGERSRAFDDKQPVVSGTGAVVLKPAQQELAEVNRQLEVARTETLKQTQMATFENGIAQTEMPTVVGSTASTAPSNPGSFAFKTDGAAAPGSFGGAAVAVTPTLSKDAAGQALPSTPPPMGAFDVTTNATMFAANESTRKQSNLQKQPAAAAPASTAFLDRNKKESDAAIPPISQVFNRTDALVTRRRPADSLSGAAPVLVSFRVEQAGNALRVIDADGSIYTGVLQLSQQANRAGAASPKNASSASQMTKTAEPSQTAQNYFFRVSGTNRNLRQNVVFSGNLIPLTNLFTNRGGGGAGGSGAVQGALELRAESLLSNSRISGKATIGNQEEIEVNATPGP